MRRILPLAIVLLAGCGDIELEGPQRDWPEPLCRREERYDPETGRCLRPPCVWDEDCPEGTRCDRIEGRCADLPPAGPTGVSSR